jgi:hypothetical protein
VAAVHLARRHPEVKTLALLAGTTDAGGEAFLETNPGKSVLVSDRPAAWSAVAGWSGRRNRDWHPERNRAPVRASWVHCRRSSLTAQDRGPLVHGSTLQVEMRRAEREGDAPPAVRRGSQ